MTGNDSHGAAPAARAADDMSARNRLVIAILLVSTFVVILNETVMSVAIPHLMSDLGVSANAAQWLTSAFLLTMAVVIPITGFLMQRMNTQPIFLLAMSLFSLGTLLCAVAPGLTFLIVGRVVQACGTAIMLPLLMTTVITLVPPETRGKTMGNISIVISVAPAIGPTLSGLILDNLGWRWMFIIVLPIALAALTIGGRRIQNVTEPRYAPLDYLSVVLAAAGFGGFVYGLSRVGESAGKPGPMLWAAVIGGLAVVALFIWRQIRLQAKDKALLDLRTFRSRNFTLSIVMMGVNMMAMFGIIILVPLFLQNVLGVNALQTGLVLLPGGLLMGLLAPVVGRVYDRIGARPLIVPGAFLVSGVLFALTMVGTDTNFYAILAGHLVLSMGLALLFTPLFTTSLGSVPAYLYSHASAILGTIQQVAGAAGIALFVSLMTLRAQSEIAVGADQAEAMASGLRLAFQYGFAISLVSLATAFFVRRPEATEPHGAHGAPEPHPEPGE